MRTAIFIMTIIISFKGWTAPPPKLGICASCHGLDGQATQSGYPNLAGQSANYLLKQLQDYRNKTRSSAIMQAFASTLTEKEMIEMSKYYSKITPKTSPQRKVSAVKGELLYKIGNRRQGITACIACHGPKGQGNDAAKYPNLSHQDAEYLGATLKAFHDKQRQNDPQQIMQMTAAKLHQADIDALVVYLQQLD